MHCQAEAAATDWPTARPPRPRHILTLPLVLRSRDALADLRYSKDGLELGDLIHRIDEVQALDAVQVALMRESTCSKPGAPGRGTL